MQEQFCNDLINAISDKRLEPYFEFHGYGINLKGYASYAWNCALSESLYSPLQALEVGLRNSIHNAATQHFGSDHWFLGGSLEVDHLGEKMIAQVKTRLKDDNKSAVPENFIPTFTLGFWVNLFNRNYEQRAKNDKRLWPHLMSNVFPYIPRSERVRSKLWDRLDQVRKLRNRIFHYEPIWHWKRLSQRHDEVIELIGWTNSSMLELVRATDNFPKIYNVGVEYYEDLLIQLTKGDK